jgi:hypothetical protein
MQGCAVPNLSADRRAAAEKWHCSCLSAAVPIRETLGGEVGGGGRETLEEEEDGRPRGEEEGRKVIGVSLERQPGVRAALLLASLDARGEREQEGLPTRSAGVDRSGMTASPSPARGLCRQSR